MPTAVAIALGCALLFSALSAQAERRVALVIGNDEYAHLPDLNNAGKDARDMAAKLKTLGFEVIARYNASEREMGRAIRRFSARLSAGGTGLAYYAGHGIQADGTNYLIPADANIEIEDDLRYEALDANDILQAMKNAGNPLNILILDACRDNPLPKRVRSSARGLAITTVPSGVKGTAILYAAGPGQTAQDGPKGGNGVFTGALLKHMGQPGWTLEQVFKATSREVLRATNNRQRPCQLVSLQGDFVFKPAKPAPVTTSRTQPSPRRTTDPSMAIWNAIQNSRQASDFETFLKTYPNSPMAPFAKGRLEVLGQSKVAIVASPPKPAKVPITECDNLAASSADAHAVTPGVSWANFTNAVAAIAACRDAVARYSNTPRFKFQLGRALDKSGKHVEAMKWYQEAATRDYALAQHNIGGLYYNGSGVEKNDAEALRWYRKAAAQGVPNSQYQVAQMYFKGRGVIQNDVEAARWYKRAANKGFARAQNDLGSWYESGRGVAKDREEAVRWYREAAAQGYEKAKENLRRLGKEKEEAFQIAEEELWRRIKKTHDPDLIDTYLAQYPNGKNRYLVESLKQSPTKKSRLAAVSNSDVRSRWSRWQGRWRGNISQCSLGWDYNHWEAPLNLTIGIDFYKANIYLTNSTSNKYREFESRLTTIDRSEIQLDYYGHKIEITFPNNGANVTGRARTKWDQTCAFELKRK